MMMKDLGLISRLPRIVVAQAEAGQPWFDLSYLKNFRGRSNRVQAQKTLASGIHQIGNPVSVQKAIRTLERQFNGIRSEAGHEEELADARGAGHLRTGMFNCPHTGVALACHPNCPPKAGKD